jgi:hypothetical protein
LYFHRSDSDENENEDEDEDDDVGSTNREHLNGKHM